MDAAIVHLHNPGAPLVARQRKPAAQSRFAAVAASHKVAEARGSDRTSSQQQASGFKQHSTVAAVELVELLIDPSPQPRHVRRWLSALDHPQAKRVLKLRPPAGSTGTASPRPVKKRLGKSWDRPAGKASGTAGNPAMAAIVELLQARRLAARSRPVTARQWPSLRDTPQDQTCPTRGRCPIACSHRRARCVRLQRR